jgi:hypothetical protein
MKFAFTLSCIALISLFVTSVYAGPITGACDQRIANERECTDWMQTNLKILGCTLGKTACVMHPWGSDFIKSWVCEAASANCEPFNSKTCAPGSIHVFKDGWDVCRKTKSTADRFVGECKHQNGDRGFVLKSCDESAFPCAQYGGEADSVSVGCQKKGLFQKKIPLTGAPDCTQIKKTCADLGGEPFGDWSVTCRFRDMKVMFHGSTCDELRSRCEIGNSAQGANGILRSCIAE